MDEKQHSYCSMDIIWGCLLDALQLLSEIALAVFTVLHGNVTEEQIFTIIQKGKIASCSPFIW